MLLQYTPAHPQSSTTSQIQVPKLVPSRRLHCNIEIPISLLPLAARRPHTPRRLQPSPNLLQRLKRRLQPRLFARARRPRIRPHQHRRPLRGTPMRPRGTPQRSGRGTPLQTRRRVCKLELDVAAAARLVRGSAGCRGSRVP
jgi:hypothetical protein